MFKTIIIRIALFFLILVNYTQGQYLNPGDGVRITFLNITDQISGDYFIQPDGYLQLPYVGLINTNQVEYTKIKSEIYNRYDSLYKKPDLTIQSLYKINILGEVRTPGFYYVIENEKMSGIFALAGGVTGDADLDNVIIIRDDKEVEIDAENIIERGGTAADFGLKSGDRIFVPRSWWADARSYAFIISGVAVLATVISLFLR